MAKRVFFPNAPSTIDDNQRYMLGVGLDPNPLGAGTDPFSNKEFLFNVFTGRLDVSNKIPEITGDPSSVQGEQHAVVNSGGYKFTYYTKNGNIKRGTLT